MTTTTIEPSAVGVDSTADQSPTLENEEKNTRLDKAGALIASGARWSVAASIIPVPYVDMASLAAVQTKLVIDLAKLYGEKASKQAVSGVISVMLGTLVPVGAAQAVAGSTAKLVPGVGSIVGFVSMAAFGSAATYAIGKVFVRHFESGGTLCSFGEAAIKADLKKEFAKASAA